MTILRTGIDLVEISRLEQLNPAILRRFARRVYTAAELQAAGYTDDGENPLPRQWASLAGRFAAKEAVAKALGCGIGAVSWQEIEIHQGAQGEPVLKLHGQAQRMAAELGLQNWSISISHSPSYAVAVAVALGESQP